MTVSVYYRTDVCVRETHKFNITLELAGWEQ